MGSVDSMVIGWHEDEIAKLDRSVDEATNGLEQLHTDDVASKERRRDVDARGIAKDSVAEAKRRREAMATTPPAEQRAAVDSYSGCRAGGRRGLASIFIGRKDQDERRSTWRSAF